MDKNDLKKLLAGLSLVALVSGAGLSVSGCVATGSSTNGGSANQADGSSAPAEADTTLTG